MKTVIVRTPETDRKLVEIPTQLSDLEDSPANEAGRCEGKVEFTDPTCITGGAGWFSPTLVEDYLTNATAITGGISPNFGGLFMVKFSALWASVLPPMGGGCSAALANERGTRLLLNGDVVDGAVVGGGGFDSGGLALRMEAGDQLSVEVNAGATGGGLAAVSLEIIRFSP